MTVLTYRSIKTSIVLYAAFAVLGVSVAEVDVCSPPASGTEWSVWLDKQEEAGGHTKACHLGVDVNGLIGRIENRGGHHGPACFQSDQASAWSGKYALLRAIKPEIERLSKENIEAPGRYVLSGGMNEAIGTVVSPYKGKPGKNRSACPERHDYKCTKTRKWIGIVHRAEDGACYLLTAYPVP